MKLTGENRSTGGKNCPSATLSTGTDPGSNPGLRGGRPATNRLSHGTAIYFVNSVVIEIYRVNAYGNIIVSLFLENKSPFITNFAFLYGV
jgi:hypothetical protein